MALAVPMEPNVMSLSALVFLPLVGALLIAATPKKAVGMQRGIALLTTLAVAAIGIALCLRFDGSSAAMQFTEVAPWFTLPGGIDVHYRLGMDGISVLLVGLTSILGPIVVTLLATTVHPVAGLAVAVVAGVGGSLAFAAQRRTEPPPHRHDRTVGARPPLPWRTVVPLAVVCAAAMFANACRACSEISPPTNSPECGSSGICPEKNTMSPTRVACEYGPMAAGALSVCTMVRLMSLLWSLR